MATVTTEEAPVRDEPQHRWQTLLPVGVLALGMAAQLVIIIGHREGAWFRADAWHYLTRRGPVPGADLGLFVPWGGHWQTIPVLVYRGLFGAFGAASYTPYLMTVLVLHLVACGLLYAVLRRVGHGPWVALIPVWLLLFYGAGGEAFTFDGPMPLMLSLVFGLAAVLVALPGRLPVGRRVVVALLLLLAVMSSGLGLVVLCLVGVLVWLRQGLVAAVGVVAPASLSVVVWFLAIGHDAGRLDLGLWPRVPRFLWTGVTSSLQNLLGVPGAGVLLLIVLVATVVGARQAPTAARQLAVAGLAACLAQMILTALATSPDFELGAYQSRYAYLVVAFLAPAMALLVSLIRSRFVSSPAASPRTIVVASLVVVLLGAVTIHGITYELAVMRFLRGYAVPYRMWVLGSIAAVEAGERILVEKVPLPIAEPPRVPLLTSPVIAREMAGQPASAQQRVDAENLFFTYVGSTPPGAFPGPVSFEVAGGESTTLTGGGCERIVPSSDDTIVRWSVVEASQVTVQTGNARVTTVLERDGVRSAPVSWASQSGPFVVVSTASGAELEVHLRGTGPYVVCVG